MTAPIDESTGPWRRVAGFAERYLRAAALVAYTFTFGILSPRRRAFIASLARDANYRRVPQTVPTIDIDDLTRPSTNVVLPFPRWVEGNVSLLELLVIARIARERDPRLAFEIGTFDGRSTATLAANTSEDAVICTLDLPTDQSTAFALAPGERAYVDKPAPGALVHGSAFAPKVRQLFGDSASFDFTTYSADLVFIDGSHAYSYVINDSLKALSMLRNGSGMILWHDYGEWEGVTRSLNELHDTDARFANLRHIEGTTLVLLER